MFWWFWLVYYRKHQFEWKVSFLQKWIKFSYITIFEAFTVIVVFHISCQKRKNCYTKSVRVQILVLTAIDQFMFVFYSKIKTATLNWNRWFLEISFNRHTTKLIQKHIIFYKYTVLYFIYIYIYKGCCWLCMRGPL